MATTYIEQDIENITGVADADDQFVISAQKFVVASVPKDLLTFAMAASSHSTDGSAIAFENDSIIDVQRNGYSCKEIPFSQSKWASDSGSLKKATAFFPVYWVQNGGIKIAPDTDGSNAGYVFYINSAAIDDDSDLRTAVVYHSCASEFTKLATSKVIDYVDISVPIAPTLVDTTITFTASAPTFTAPLMSVPDFSDTNSWITTEEDSEMLAARVQEIQAKIGEYSARMSEAQALFNKENTEYQARLQVAIQNAQLSSQDDAKKLQDYSAKVQAYSSEVNEMVQKIGTAVQNMNYYSQESKKYYEWAVMHLQTYIQNNEKSFNKSLAMQAVSQQQSRR